MREKRLFPLLDLKGATIWEDEDPKVRMLAMSAERSGVGEWTTARVTALARDLGMTIWVLCAAAGAFTQATDLRYDIFRLVLDRRMIEKSIKTNVWPPLLAQRFAAMEEWVKLRNGDRKATLLGPSERNLAKTLARKRHGRS